MDRCQGPLAACCRIAAACALVMLASGCAVSIATSSSVATTINAIFALGVTSGYTPGGSGPLDPDRRVVEQDCSQPVADASANLRCR